MAESKPDPKPDPKPEPTGGVSQPDPTPAPKPEPTTRQPSDPKAPAQPTEPSVPADDPEPQAGRTEMEEQTVPVQIGADIGQLARAATANRTVGIDDDPENAARMVEAVEDASTTVNLTVNQPAGKPLPVPARAAIAREKRRGDAAQPSERFGASSRSARTAGTDVELHRPTALADPMGDLGVHTVTINDRAYTWAEGDDAPAEAQAVYDQSVAANTTSTGIPPERMP